MWHNQNLYLTYWFLNFDQLDLATLTLKKKAVLIHIVEYYVAYCDWKHSGCVKWTCIAEFSRVDVAISTLFKSSKLGFHKYF